MEASTVDVDSSQPTSEIVKMFMQRAADIRSDSVVWRTQSPTTRPEERATTSNPGDQDPFLAALRLSMVRLESVF
jgi:hypothetical protein